MRRKHTDVKQAVLGHTARWGQSWDTNSEPTPNHWATLPSFIHVYLELLLLWCHHDLSPELQGQGKICHRQERHSDWQVEPRVLVLELSLFLYLPMWVVSSFLYKRRELWISLSWLSILIGVSLLMSFQPAASLRHRSHHSLVLTSTIRIQLKSRNLPGAELSPDKDSLRSLPWCQRLDPDPLNRNTLPQFLLWIRGPPHTHTHPQKGPG